MSQPRNRQARRLSSRYSARQKALSTRRLVELFSTPPTWATGTTVYNGGTHGDAR